MKPILATVCCILLIAGAVRADEKPLRILASTNDLAAIAAAVGGDHAEIDVVSRASRDPHSVEVRPSTMRKAARADCYLAIGLSLDSWAADIVRGSRNRNLVLIECAEAISPRGKPEGDVDASMGDVHPEGNPHYWLDPLNGGVLSRYLAGKFSSMRPELSDVFDRNAQAFAERIHAEMPRWEECLRGRSFVEYHDTWLYLAARFEMTIVGKVEPLPGISPTARQLAALSEAIRATGVRVVVRDPFHSEETVAFLERETGVRGVVLPSVCESPAPEAYFEHFDRICSVLGATGAR